MKLSDLNPSLQIKVCIYGHSGAGKTCFASSFPGPIWVADFDGKISSAAAYLRSKNPKQLDSIDYEDFTYSPSSGGLRVFQKFSKCLNSIEAACAEGKMKYKTVVLDSLTTFSDALMQDILAENPGGKRPAPGVPALQDYLIFNNYLKPILSRLLALPCNLVVVGHIAMDKDELTGEIHHKLALSGKLPELIPVLFQEVYRAFTEVKDGATLFKLQTRSNGKYMCRTQIPSLPTFIDSSYEGIMKGSQ